MKKLRDEFIELAVKVIDKFPERRFVCSIIPKDVIYICEWDKGFNEIGIIRMYPTDSDNATKIIELKQLLKTGKWKS